MRATIQLASIGWQIKNWFKFLVIRRRPSRTTQQVVNRAIYYIAGELASLIERPSEIERPLTQSLAAISHVFSRGEEDPVRVGVLIPDEEPTGSFRLLAGVGYSTEGLRRLRLPMAPSESAAGEAWVTMRTITIPDVLRDTHFRSYPAAGRDYRSMLIAPVFSPSGEGCAALLVLDSLNFGYFSSDDAWLAELFAMVLSSMILLGRRAENG